MSARPGFRNDPSDARIEQLRVPPHSIEAEQAVLGGLMLAPESFDRVGDKLTADDFYRRDHQLIWRAIADLVERDRPCDAVTLGEWFDSQGLSEQVAGGAYLIELASNTPSAANITAYAEIVRDKAVMRKLIEVGTQIVNDGFQPDGRETTELLATAEQKVFAIAESGARGRTDFTAVNTALKDAFDVLQDRFNNGGSITGLPTGYHEFDDMTAGLQPTDLIILAARPAMGKTTFALNIAEYAAIKSKKAVAVFSMEMSAAQLALRLISSNGRVNAQRLRTGQLEDEDWSRVTSAIRMLKETKIFIDDTPALSPDVLRAKSRRLHRENNGLGLIVIDYLQLMAVPGNSENRATEISEISRSLKALAKELKVPVIALSQLNRSLETRTDKRPVMADLRESGAIEQDADIIVFIYRDEYYHKDSADKGLAEIIIGKQRSGPTGALKLKFFGEYTRFDNLAHDSVGSFE
ncbi:replicative DNA helicase [Pseudoxanthomonas helianthi]|uniref:Replicative DNA helicase n=1 Tax=Pseudoxanthomonas helianthi TaxID=1453541 RepID=A0A941AW99_9GAMM|nr:replicative DNA helicase [Pseudoxanthomonas helianthi]MBP3985442.1 replicative DNA helicase [Pseudoxanthomonas helianthi]